MGGRGCWGCVGGQAADGAEASSCQPAPASSQRCCVAAGRRAACSVQGWCVRGPVRFCSIIIRDHGMEDAQEEGNSTSCSSSRPGEGSMQVGMRAVQGPAARVCWMRAVQCNASQCRCQAGWQRRHSTTPLAGATYLVRQGLHLPDSSASAGSCHAGLTPYHPPRRSPLPNAPAATARACTCCTSSWDRSWDLTRPPACHSPLPPQSPLP